MSYPVLIGAKSMKKRTNEFNPMCDRLACINPLINGFIDTVFASKPGKSCNSIAKIINAATDKRIANNVVLAEALNLSFILLNFIGQI
jgi:hypothetical protein